MITDETKRETIKDMWKAGDSIATIAKEVQEQTTSVRESLIDMELITDEPVQEKPKKVKVKSVDPTPEPAPVGNAEPVEKVEVVEKPIVPIKEKKARKKREKKAVIVENKPARKKRGPNKKKKKVVAKVKAKKKGKNIFSNWIKFFKKVSRYVKAIKAVKFE